MSFFQNMNLAGCWRILAMATSLTACSIVKPPSDAINEVNAGLSAQSCADLAGLLMADPPVADLTIDKSIWHTAGLRVAMRDAESAPLPEHCEIRGRFGGHDGVIGGPYETAFAMRLPLDWNGRFLFQGGGGSNGVVGEPIGYVGPGNRTGLERGYAIISQDSGHNNAINRLTSHGNELVFGHDPVARANYGHASLKPVYDLAQMTIRMAYGEGPQHNFFWGCSKGGQEGMAFAQRYPDSFDGIVAMAPGMSLPRAAIAEAWDVQQFASILKSENKPVTVENLKSVFTPEQFDLIGQTILATCDTDDGLQDDFIGAIGACTTDRVRPMLEKYTCDGGTNLCLTVTQISALSNVMEGAHDGSGKLLYAPFAWDSGITDRGWKVWKFGIEDGPPALNVILGGGSLAAVFTTPPTALTPNPAEILSLQMAFNFDVDAEKIYQTEPPYITSAWQDVGMRSSNLSAFQANGGKLIVPHGNSDPVFSVLDTINWWDEVNEKAAGKAAEFVRVFPVPGMNHCNGGPATDIFDSLQALEEWVVEGKAPDQIIARTTPNGQFSDLERPLCPYPKVAMPEENNAGELSCQLR